jgi:hypothetical protein
MAAASTHTKHHTNTISKESQQKDMVQMMDALLYPSSQFSTMQK